MRARSSTGHRCRRRRLAGSPSPPGSPGPPDLVPAQIAAARRAIRELLKPFLRANVVYSAIVSLLLNIAARVISGAALWWLAAQLLGSATPPAADMIAIWAAAWLLGYITPGASAGLGVREAVIIASLAGLGVPMAGATLVAIAFRVTTTIGDLIFAASGWVSWHFMRSPPFQR